MKKLFSLMLAVMMLASMFAISASAVVVSPNYTVIEGAVQEAIYVDQDFNDIEENADLTQNPKNETDPDANISEGALNLTFKDSKNLVTENVDFTNGEITLELDVCRPYTDAITDNTHLTVIVARDENAENENISHYGVWLPVSALEKDVWYEYRVKFSEAAYNDQINAGSTPKDAATSMTSVQYRKKGTDAWTTMRSTGGLTLAGYFRGFAKASGVSIGSASEYNIQMYLQCYSGVKTEGYTADDLSVSVDNVKFYTPGNPGEEVVRDYPINSGTICVTDEEEVSLTYEGANNFSWKRYDKDAKTLAEGETNIICVSFDAVHTSLGMPLTFHISGSAKRYGLDIRSTEDILNTWYSYKVVALDSYGAGNINIQKIYRKVKDSNEPYVELTNTHIRRVTTGSRNVNHLAYGYWSAHSDVACTVNSAGEAVDLTKTGWTVANVQVTETPSTVTGLATLENGVLTADIDFIAAVPAAIPILAVYEEGGRLVDVDFEKDVDGEGSVELSADYTEGNVAKIFVWEDFDKPIASKVLDITSAIK